MAEDKPAPVENDGKPQHVKVYAKAELALLHRFTEADFGGNATLSFTVDEAIRFYLGWKLNKDAVIRREAARDEYVAALENAWKETGE